MSFWLLLFLTISRRAREVKSLLEHLQPTSSQLFILTKFEYFQRMHFCPKKFHLPFHTLFLQQSLFSTFRWKVSGVGWLFQLHGLHFVAHLRCPLRVMLLRCRPSNPPAWSAHVSSKAYTHTLTTHTHTPVPMQQAILVHLHVEIVRRQCLVDSQSSF